MNTTLTETQKSILIAAAEHPEHRLEWFPEGIRGGARAKVLGSLQTKGLIDYDNDHAIINEAGLAALGLLKLPIESTEERSPDSDVDPATETPKARKQRENSKQAKVIAMLNRPEGATLDQLVEITGWQKHTVRGALSILGKKQGIPIESSKTEAGRIYRAAANSAE